MSEHVQNEPPAHSSQHVQSETPGHHSHEPHGAHAAFSAEVWEEYHKSDRGAGGAVVVLMTAIFAIGLVLYSIIAIVVAS